MEIDTRSWGSLELVQRIVEGNRNEVWRGSLEGATVSVRRSRRHVASLEWELDLITFLDRRGFRVPTVIETLDGHRHADGLVVQHWLEGSPPESDQDWRLVAETLHGIHGVTRDYPQRPGCVAVSKLDSTSTSVDADMSALPSDVANEILEVFAKVQLPLSVIHGDPMASNIRIDTGGRVGLLDFDESRVDVAWHDLSNLGVQILDDEEHELANQLSDAWEAANGWLAEPDYALRRLHSLRASLRQRL